MNEGDLESFVTRSRRILQQSPSMTGKATELRIVLPFLGLLGWDVHGQEVAPDYDVESDGETLTVDHALCVDRVPAVFVVTGAADEELPREAGRRLTGAMSAADVEWGIATNGRSYAFLTREDGDQRRVSCELAGLPEEGAVLAHYTREAAVQRRDEQARSVRTEVADALAEDRPGLVESIHEALVPEGEAGPVEGELRAATESFVDGVIGALSAGDRPTAFEDAGDADASPGAGDPGVGDTPDGTGDPDRSTTGGSAGGDERPASDDAGESTDDSPDTEYVVRFFNGRSSVGAVGHSRSGEAMAQAIEYMIEQHSLDARLDLPWGNGDDRALLNYDPVHPDGTEMAGPRQLSNGYYVDTAVDVGIGQAAVEKLAEQSGLRVMFRGDWPERE